jgi:sec-independent protein translocase protein TatC
MEPDTRLSRVATPGVQPGLQPGAQPAARKRRWPRLPFRRGGNAPQPPDKGQMTWTGHLVELRNRIYISALSLVPGTVLGFAFSGQIIHFLRSPLPTSDPLEALGLTDALMIQLQIAMITGVIVGMPVILYQFWAFISPGLTPSERSAARPWVPLAMVFFALGVGVAYFILPYATGFLYNFQSKDIHILLTADAYFGFVSTLFLAFGLIMEFPIVLVLLSKVGIVSSAGLRRNRRMGILGSVLVSALITPGADIVSPLVMSVVLYGLFEASILLIRMNGR